MEITERVQAQLGLGRVEEETKRLALIPEELEGLADPMRKEVVLVRKKIDSVNKELKSLGHTVQKKEREYKETHSSCKYLHVNIVELYNLLAGKIGIKYHEPKYWKFGENMNKYFCHAIGQL